MQRCSPTVTGRTASGCAEKQPKRGRLWLNDGSCVRLRAERADHVWSYDFVHQRTHDGRAFRTLNIMDEFTRESLAIRVRRKLSSTEVIDVLTDLFILRGNPAVNGGGIRYHEERPGVRSRRCKIAPRIAPCLFRHGTG